MGNVEAVYFDKFWLKFSHYARRWYVAAHWKAATRYGQDECRDVKYYLTSNEAYADLRSRIGFPEDMPIVLGATYLL